MTTLGRLLTLPFRIIRWVGTQAVRIVLALAGFWIIASAAWAIGFHPAYLDHDSIRWLAGYLRQLWLWAWHGFLSFLGETIHAVVTAGHS
jgi:hypothetical protein